jgi:hypothetical protein
MTREEAEALRSDDRHWTLGVIYACRADPRVIVRNRFVVGWTWNFGHRWVVPTLLAFVLFALAPAAWLFRSGVRDVQILLPVVAACVLVLVGFAHYVATGPR